MSLPILADPPRPISIAEAPSGDDFKVWASKFQQALVVDWNNLVNWVQQLRSYESRVLTGLTVTYSGVGLIYNVSAGTYVINGQYYSYPGGQVTLAPPDLTFPRIDAIVATVASTVIVLTGTPSANPVVPTIDTNTQLLITTIYVPTSGSPIINPPGGGVVLLTPLQLRAPISATIPANVAAPTVVANLTEAGTLLLIGIILNASAQITGAPTIDLVVNVDGTGGQTFNIFTASLNFAPGMRPFVTSSIGPGVSADGIATPIVIWLPINVPYATTLVVGVNISVAAGAGDMIVSVIRGTNTT